RVLSFADDQENAKLIQKDRNENDKKQWFQLQDAGDYYLVRNMSSNKYLTNKYNPNDGAEIVQNQLSDYDNPSERWKISKQNGTWFRFENKSCNNASSALEVSQSKMDDGAQVVQSTNWASKDNQLWGFEFVSDGTDVYDLKASSLYIVPTIVENEFSVGGDESEYTELTIYSITGLKVSEFSQQSVYNVSGLSAGTYFVVMSKNGAPVKRTTILKK
ncbi:MAG: RICIN domain-containing protein, partial [Paludibacteraceae bacterium]|nr:RICIN domain-containing protein [Paludibacteraceae bacterium]